jgi:hypothetical protein
MNAESIEELPVRFALRELGFGLFEGEIHKFEEVEEGFQKKSNEELLWIFVHVGPILRRGSFEQQLIG